MSKCQCGRDTLFLDDLGVGPLVCRGCGALLCPLCDKAPCKRCEERARLGVKAGDVVVLDGCGARSLLAVAMVDDDAGWIWATRDGKLAGCMGACVYGPDGKTDGWPISHTSRGAGTIRLPLAGELEMIRTEERYRRHEAKALSKETETLVEIYGPDDDLHALAGVAARYRLALQKIVKNPDNARRIAKEVLGE